MRKKEENKFVKHQFCNPQDYDFRFGMQLTVKPQTGLGIKQSETDGAAPFIFYGSK